MQPRIRRPPQFRIRRHQRIEKSRQIFFGKSCGLLRDPRQLVLRRLHQVGLGSAHPRHQQIPEVPDRFAAEMLQVLPIIN